jgi:hypothetical protein
MSHSTDVPFRHHQPYPSQVHTPSIGRSPRASIRYRLRMVLFLEFHGKHDVSKTSYINRPTLMVAFVLVIPTTFALV